MTKLRLLSLCSGIGPPPMAEEVEDRIAMYSDDKRDTRT